MVDHDPSTATRGQRRFRFDYVYDDRGNWVERVGSLQETGTMQHYEMELRTFTYYTA
jgi:hypothetical protein